MILKNICHFFERRINDEIAAGQQFNYLYVQALKEQEIIPEAKRFLGIPGEERLSMYDFAKQSVAILSKLRFIYLLSLLEAFGKEYIAQREGVHIDEVRVIVDRWKPVWQRQQDGVSASCSLINLAFLKFILSEQYRLDFSSVKEEYFWEAGALRNCVVHHGGLIANEKLRVALNCTISYLGAVDAVGSPLIITDRLIWAYIEAARKFLRLCDN